METLLPVGDVELCVVTSDSSSEPALLLIGTTVAAWDDELVERSPTGSSSATTCGTPADRPPSTPTRPGYTLRDLVTDAVGVLDGSA